MSLCKDQLPSSQKPPTGLFPEPVQSIPCPYIIFPKTFFGAYLMMLTISGLYRVRWKDTWMMNWRGFGRKRSWTVWVTTILPFLALVFFFSFASSFSFSSSSSLHSPSTIHPSSLFLLLLQRHHLIHRLPSSLPSVLLLLPFLSFCSTPISIISSSTSSEHNFRVWYRVAW